MIKDLCYFVFIIPSRKNKHILNEILENKILCFISLMYTDTHTFLFEGARQLKNIKSGSFCTLLEVHIHILWF